MSTASRCGIFLALSLLLCLKTETALAWIWPFTSSDPAEFQHDHIKALTSQDFEEHVMKEDGKYYFVKFYANWCGHCKTLAPKWGQIAAENNNSNLEFLQVECSNNNKLCRKAAVKGFPEIKIFYNGRIGYQVTGGVDLEELRKIVKEAPEKVQEGFQKAMAEEQKKADPEKLSSKRSASDEL